MKESSHGSRIDVRAKQDVGSPTVSHTKLSAIRPLERAPSMLKNISGAVGRGSKVMSAKLEQRLGGMRKHHKYNDLQPRSLGFLGLKNPLRYRCIELIKSKWFDRFILFAIIFNTIVLSLVDYSDPWDTGPNPTKLGNIIIMTTNNLSLIIFSLEAAIKIIALGFSGPYSYTFDNWNILDIIVVVSGLISQFLVTFSGDSAVELSKLRIIRVLRPLRTLHSLPGLKILVNSVLSSLPALFNVTILLTFSYLVFSILGMDIWAGSFHGRCRLTEFPVLLNFNASNPPDNYTYPNQTWIDIVTKNASMYRCLNISNDSPEWTRQNCFWPIDMNDTVGHYCGSRECTPGTYCGSNYDRNGQPRFFDIMTNGTTIFSIMTEPDFTTNLNFGFTTFDDVGSTMIIIFQIVTASGWMVLTQNTQDSLSSVIGGIYFNFVLFVGMCFLLQLNMAVVYYEYQKAKELQEIQRLNALTLGMKRHNSLSIRRESIIRFIKSQQVLSMNTSTNSKTFFGCIKNFIQTISFNIATSKKFKTIARCITALNVLLLCSVHHPVDESFEYWSEIVNFCCLVYFLFEMTIKIIAGGIKSYFSDTFNKFDFLTIIAGIIEIFLNPPSFIDGNPGNTSPISTFRIVRALKLANSWSSLNRLLVAIMDAMGEILNFLFFLVMFIYIYALLGMELFATKYQFDHNNRPLPYNNTNPTSTKHRTNFDSMFDAFFSVFQIITYDDWPAVMYDGWLSVGVIAPIYFISIIVIGVWIIMSMFCAIMVDSVMEGIHDNSNSDDEDDVGLKLRATSVSVGRIKRAMRLVLNMRKVGSNAVHPLESFEKDVLNDRSLFIFSGENPIRRLCTRCIHHRRWKQAVITSIVIACMFAALDSPLQDSTVGVGYVVETANNVFAVLFTIEMVITIIARGLILSPGSYLRDPWCILDCFIVSVSLLSWSIGNDASGALSGLRSLRSLRALRPLRVINKLPQLKVVVNTLFRCLPDIGRSLVFFLFMLIMFAVPCVIFFKGALSSCSISPYQYLNQPGYTPLPPWFPSNYSGQFTMEELHSIDIMTFPKSWMNMNETTRQLLTATCNMTKETLNPSSYLPTSKEICECFPETNWSQVVPQSFDNILVALGSLYELTTFEGWTAVANACIDATGPDSQPLLNNHPAFMLFWFVYMIVGAFFVTNMFIAVLCDSFMREKYGVMVTEEQINWIKMQRKVLSLNMVIQYDPPHEPWRRICFNIIKNKKFEYLIIGCILLNMAGMTITFASQPMWMTISLILLNRFCLVVFTFEAILKLIAYGKNYFIPGWNRFDFLIVILTFISEFLPQNSSFSAGATAFRVFRVGRALRLINKAKLMKSLFNTVLVSLPSVGNVMALLMLMYYIYSALGVQLFAKLNYGPNLLNSHQNFHHTSFQILIGFSTGENWDNFMWEIYDSECPNNSCATWFVVPYFYSFTLFVGYICLNIFSAIIVDAIGDDGKSPITPESLELFAMKWSRFDPHGRGIIEMPQLVVLLMQLPPPLGFKYVPGFTSSRIQKAIGDLNIPVYDKKYVHFKDVPRALVQRTLSEGNKSRFDEITQVMVRLGLDQEFDAIWKRTHNSKEGNALLVKPKLPVKHVVATRVIQGFLVRASYKRRSVNRMNITTGHVHGISGDSIKRNDFYYSFLFKCALNGDNILLLCPVLTPLAKSLQKRLENNENRDVILRRIHLICVSDLSNALNILSAIDPSRIQSIFIDTSPLCPPSYDIFELAQLRSLSLLMKRLAAVHQLKIILLLNESNETSILWRTSLHIHHVVNRSQEVITKTILTGVIRLYPSLLNNTTS